MPPTAMINPGATGNKGISLSSLIEGQSAKPMPSGLKNSQKAGLWIGAIHTTHFIKEVRILQVL